MPTSSAVTLWLLTTSDMVDTDADLADTRRRAPTASARPGGVRIAVGYTTIACALPYFVLKLIWLSGGTLGVSDLTMLHDAGMIALNTITAGMDLVAILIALAFTHQWGLRVPAWLVLPPMWVASGLLARFVVVVPITTIAAALTSGSPPRVAAGPVQPWVYALVYTEFAGLGIGLMLAFVLYARARWAVVFQSTTRTAPPGITHDVQLPLATVAALIAMLAGALNIAWAFGSSIGVGADVAARRTFSSHVINAIDGALMIAAVVGVLLLVYRIGRRVPLWLALTLAWVGGGSLFGWGLWHMIVVLPNTALVRGRPDDMALFDLLALFQLLAGLVIGLVMFFLLAEKATSRER
jgi:hypothetical protein